MGSRVRLAAAAALVLCSSLRAQAVSQKFYPVQAQFGTGWTDGTNKYDTTICWKTDGARRGWAYFDHLDTLYVPFDSARIHYYQIADTNNPTVTLRWCQVDPITAGAYTIYNALNQGMTLATEGGGTDWHHVTLTAPTPWPAVPGSRMCVGFCEDGVNPPTPRAGAADGWGTQNQPYIEFFHH
ncbi:MAG: hypothetical protein ABIK62_02275 [candidate division WOR-3 bacterium]